MNVQEVAQGKRWLTQAPVPYLFSWTITIVMFMVEGLFPLALVWQGSRVKQRGRHIQIVTLILAYTGMIVFALGDFLVVHQPLLGLVALVICALGSLVAFVRPRSQPSMPQWMVLVATWVMAGGNLLNGLIYYSITLLAPIGVVRPPLIPALPLGEVIWQGVVTGSIFCSGGVLLLLTAVLISCQYQRNASDTDCGISHKR
ncbi:hypothetical protein KDAU_07380 [Dictyobacter aurantiacus]|uniref:Uncharacterized protein n=2 Tax=Dictyobacter aurantiacus TaxID=1936993 RepID=A0A401Z999_9CHLR|nr:hypothetical protein KDAU_07380 [Dictyobacter aurantiacus]